VFAGSLANSQTKNDDPPSAALPLNATEKTTLPEGPKVSCAGVGIPDAAVSPAV